MLSQQWILKNAKESKIEKTFVSRLEDDCIRKQRKRIV